MNALHALLAACLLAIAPFARAPLAAEARIAVAANFTQTARALAPLFHAASGHSLKISHASSGKLATQIMQGAPFDVFLSADVGHAARVEKAGFAVPGSRVVYASGRLALYSRDDQAFEDGETWLKRNAFRRLAIANPKTAPYGLAARQTLKHLGIWRMLRTRLVRGESVAQAFQFVATGNVDAGLVAMSQIKNRHGARWQIPESYHAPIEQAAVLLKHGARNPAARAFLDFLLGDSARALIESQGYALE